MGQLWSQQRKTLQQELEAHQTTKLIYLNKQTRLYTIFCPKEPPQLIVKLALIVNDAVFSHSCWLVSSKLEAKKGSPGHTSVSFNSNTRFLFFISFFLRGTR